MCSTDEDLSWWGDTEDTKAWILVAQFNGAFDADGAARLAVGEVLRLLPTECVATFNTDVLLNYRPHWPFVVMSDWVLESVGMPESVLGRVKDDLGNSVLVLHGVEPDARRESFSRIVTEPTVWAGVEIVASFNGIPSEVPHMRPAPVRAQAMEKALIPEQPQMAATLRFPTPMTTLLQGRLTNQGIPGVVFLAAIPFCAAGAAYPADTSVLLSALSDLADLSLPVGELEQDAAEEYTAIEWILESNSKVQRTAAALEEHFDALNGASRDGVPPGE